MAAKDDGGPAKEHSYECVGCGEVMECSKLAAVCVPCHTKASRTASNDAPFPGDLRDWFAGQCDVSVYRPLETLRDKLGRAGTIAEVAAYIVKIRTIEARAMLRERAKGGADG